MNKRSHSGFGLIELMVAIAISLLLFAGVLNIFLSSKQTYRGQSALSRLQENGRNAIDLMSRDIRMAGYSGCQRVAGGNISNILKDQTKVNFNFRVGIEAYNDLTGSPPAYLTDAGINPLANTDVIVVRGPNGPGVPLTRNKQAAQMFVSLLSQEPGACADGTERISGICPGDILMVSDCHKARVFQASTLTLASASELNLTHATTGTPGNNPTSWGGASAPPEE